MTIRVESAADHLGLIETIARWHWAEWGHADPGGSPQSWVNGLRRRTNRDRVPATFVAIDLDGEPVGSVTLVEHDMPDRHDLSELMPWVAGVYVTENKRGEGIGSALMRHAAREAHGMGIERLFLYTSSAPNFYEVLGWETIARDCYEGEEIVIMALTVG